MFNFGFAVEPVLGHATHHQNLLRWAKEDPEIRPFSLPIDANKSDFWQQIPVIRSNWSLQASWRTREAIAAALRVHNLDAMLLHTQSLALFAFPFMRYIPTIVSIDATPLNYDEFGSGYNHKVGGNFLLEKAKFLWNKSTFKAATILVTWCQWAKDSLVSDYDINAEKVIVIPPGVEMEQWRFGRHKTARSTNKEKVRLLFVGGDFARQGGYLLLEAFRNSLQKDCTLDIVTKDAHIQQKLAGIEGVRVHCGLAANSAPVRELYDRADIFVFPTQADCFPIAIMEAMAAGLPIIATDVGALREEVVDGVNGFIIPPSDPSAIVGAVRSLLSDESKRNAMAIASRRLAEERFDARRNYGELLFLMKHICSFKSELINAYYA